MKVNSERLWQGLMSLAEIGRTAAGGVCRLALTDEDLAARNLFIDWCEAAGLEVRIDELGNILGRREGQEPGLAPVMSGSHLDSQPLGGRFDGAYGVMAALEVVRTMNDRSVTTRRPVDIVAWTNEEGSRFPAGCMGSSVFAGRRGLGAMLDLLDLDGKSVREELKRIGFDGPEPCGGFDVAALFEAHIEQGPVLEREGKTIGVVTSAQGLRCYRIYVAGEAGHAGTVPMDQRRDAFQGAARMAVAIDDLVSSFKPTAVITVGVVNVEPGSRNTIPSETMFSIDCRCPDEDGLERLETEINRICHGLARARRLEVRIETVSAIPPVQFDPACIGHVRRGAVAAGFSHRDIVSGAGHDACHVASIAPVGMIFVPCKDGVSHNEAESATPEDLGAGAEVLYNAIVRVAGEV